MRNPDISVIVACRNERAFIEQFVASLLAQKTERYTVEFLIADGMSNDGTRQVLASICELESRVRVLDNPGRIVSTGLNAALQSASGEYVIRMDAHTDYAPDYIIQCIRVMQRTNAANVGGPARTAAKGYWARAIAAAYHSRFACGGARFHDTAFEGYVDTVPYGCWRRSMLIALGGFDESLVRNQDDELNLRLIRAGGRIYQAPEIVSWYHPRASLRTLFRQYMQYGYWKVAVIRKHRIPASLRHLIPGLFVLAVISLAVIAAALLLSHAPVAAAVAGMLLAGVLAVYGLAATAAAVGTAAQYGWMLLPVLPLVFATYHTSYGLGFITGLLHFSRRSPAQGGASSRFATLSR